MINPTFFSLSLKGRCCGNRFWREWAKYGISYLCSVRWHSTTHGRIATWIRLVAWHSGRTSVCGRRTFPVLRSTCSGQVTTYAGKPSATGQPTRPTQPFIYSRSINWVVSCNQMFARMATTGESLRGERLVWLIGAVVCLLAACRGSNCTLTRAMDGRNLRCSTICSCQSTATSKIVKRGWSRWFTV